MPTMPRVQDERIHVAVLHGEYVEQVLAGLKTVESRLATTRRAPFGCVRSGERLYIKERGGRIRATAIIGRVAYFSGLTPGGVRAVRARYNGKILGTAAYWRARRAARYATLLWLREVEAVGHGPDAPPFYGSAWVCLPAGRCVYPACVERLEVNHRAAPAYARNDAVFYC